MMTLSIFFFFQAEDGIRDDLVTGVQTCALPISRTKPQGRRNNSTNYDGQKCRKPGLPGLAPTQERYLGCLHRDECAEARRAEPDYRGYRDDPSSLPRC